MKHRNNSHTTSPIHDYLQELHRQFAGVKEGDLATYIPELAKANPNWFGICLVTATGAVYEVGDSRQPFTIQSISKPFVYGLALEDNGRAPVLAKVGVEPTGDAFNSISLDPGTGRPRNPMINAGAIASAGLIAGRTVKTRFQRLIDTFSLYAGRELSLDDSVYASENETGHRNRAIGHMLRNFDILTGDPTPTVELYFKQCSISVNCRDLGIMAATLANRGVNPVTGKQAIRGEYVESVLSVMASCGMYDFAGEWIYNIGMPAKSGVAGGVIAVLPGQMGIGVFSPPLDARGNSVRGIRVCNELSRIFDLHLFNRPGVGRSAIRLKFSGADVTSSRVRDTRESQVLRQFGVGIQVYQLQGHFTFATAEFVVRDIFDNLAAIEHLVLDLKRVLSINESACRLFLDLLEKLSATGRTLLFSYSARLPLLRRYLKAKLGARFTALFHAYEDNDPALEWCENQVLDAHLPGRTPDRSCERADYELFVGFTPAEVELLSTLLTRRHYQRGEVIINVGDEARDLFFLARGTVSVLVTLDSGARKRLATFSPGMAFGDMAVLDRAPRSAVIQADQAVECDLLSIDDLDSLGHKHPAIKIKLLENLSRGLCRKLRKANREISVFD